MAKRIVSSHNRVRYSKERAMNPFTATKIAEANTFLPDAGPLAATNLAFHDSYNNVVCDVLAQLGHDTPVIGLVADDLLLLVDGKQESERVIPEHFHQLKAIGHSAFALQLWLMQHNAQQLDTTLRSQLQANHLVLSNTLAALDILPEWERSTPTTLVDGSLEYVAELLQLGKVDEARTREYSAWMAPLVLELAGAAARLEIDGLHAAVTKWRSEMGDARWRSIYVVLCGNHQPRYRHVATQYFERLLGEHQGGGAECEDRIVFAEGVCEINEALDLLARHIVDQQASILIFGDKSRLQRDLFADVAAVYLDQVVPADSVS